MKPSFHTEFPDEVFRVEGDFLVVDRLIPTTSPENQRGIAMLGVKQGVFSRAYLTRRQLKSLIRQLQKIYDAA